MNVLPLWSNADAWERGVSWVVSQSTGGWRVFFEHPLGISSGIVEGFYSSLTEPMTTSLMIFGMFTSLMNCVGVR